MKPDLIIFAALSLVLVFAFLSGCTKGNNDGGNTSPVNGNGGSNAGTTLTPEQKTELNDNINQITAISTEIGALNNEADVFDESLDFEGGFGE